MKWEFVCSADGPEFTTEDAGVFVLCRRQRGHTLQHEWWSEDGSIRLNWWDDWSFGPLAWDDEHAGVSS